MSPTQRCLRLRKREKEDSEPQVRYSTCDFSFYTCPRPPLVLLPGVNLCYIPPPKLHPLPSPPTPVSVTGTIYTTAPPPCPPLLHHLSHHPCLQARGNPTNAPRAPCDRHAPRHWPGGTREMRSNIKRLVTSLPRAGGGASGCSCDCGCQSSTARATRTPPPHPHSDAPFSLFVSACARVLSCRREDGGPRDFLSRRTSSPSSPPPLLLMRLVPVSPQESTRESSAGIYGYCGGFHPMLQARSDVLLSLTEERRMRQVPGEKRAKGRV